MLPAPGREFPYRIELPHDYAAWYAQVRDGRENGHRADWHLLVPPLRSYGPASFEVTDDQNVCRLNVGGSADSLSMDFTSWELDSPVTRSLMVSKHRVTTS